MNNLSPALIAAIAVSPLIPLLLGAASHDVKSHCMPKVGVVRSGLGLLLISSLPGALGLSNREFAMNVIIKFMQDEEGAVAIEYGLLAALIAIVIIAGAGILGRCINGLFTAIANVLGGADWAAPACNA